MRSILISLLALLSWSVSAEDAPHADPEWAALYGIDLNAKSTIFNYEYSPRGFVFALNAVRNGDLYFHMSGPITSSWIGVGFGHEMKDTLMVIAYPSANGTNTTTSVRMGSGHTEPKWVDTHQITKVLTDGYAPSANQVTDNGTGTIISHVICHGCANWATGSLDLYSSEQHFFYALGPNKTFRSDALDANIGMHERFGRFTVDMNKATNHSGDYGRVPAPNIPQFTFPPTDASFADYGCSVAYDVTLMDDHDPAVHGFLMILAFVLIFPFGTLVKLMLKRVMWHAAIQTFGALCVVAGFAVACRVSPLYLKSKDFNSSHQIIGLITLAGVIIQFGLGLVNHTVYVRTKHATPLGSIHMLLGPLIMVLGVVNGGIGFLFAGYWEFDLSYAMAVTAVAVVFFGLLGCVVLLRFRRKAYKTETDYTDPVFGPGNDGYKDIEMRHPGPGTVQQSFGAEPPTPYVPHTPYTASLPYEPPQPYAPVVPYTPNNAYTPNTPRTFKKMEITTYALQADED